MSSVPAITRTEKYFDFQGLPPELREEIYELAFSAPYISDHDLLTKPGPPITLRLTSKAVYGESTRAYAKAQAGFEDTRNEFVQSLQDTRRDHHRISLHGTPGSGKSQLLANVIPLQWPLCEHACAEQDCYMCEAPEHRSCFGCGMWRALAMYYELHPTEKPRLVELVGTSVMHTALGFKVQEGTAAYKVYRENIYRPGSPSGKHIPLPSRSRHWWQAELDMQMHIAIRCKIRRRAVDRYWATPASQRGAFDKEAISELECEDADTVSMRRWVTYKEDSGWARSLDWQSMYAHFVVEEQRELELAGGKKKMVPAE